MTADERIQPPRLRSRRGGFTLIEVMITVAIIGILAAVAYPSYMSYIRKGNRADATSLLQAVSIAQERHRLGAISYAANFGALTPPCACNSTSERGHYTLGAFTGVTPSGYTLTANAASSIQQGDSGCTAITMTVNGGNTTYAPAACWGK